MKNIGRVTAINMFIVIIFIIIIIIILLIIIIIAETCVFTSPMNADNKDDIVYRFSNLLHTYIQSNHDSNVLVVVECLQKFIGTPPNLTVLNRFIQQWGAVILPISLSHLSSLTCLLKKARSRSVAFFYFFINFIKYRCRKTYFIKTFDFQICSLSYNAKKRGVSSNTGIH